MLLAFLIYNDGIQTIIRMAVALRHAGRHRQGSLIAALLLVQFVGIPFTFLFGSSPAHRREARDLPLARRLPAIASLAYYMTTACALLRARRSRRDGAGRQPGAEPLALRSMIPRDKSSEFFGFFAVFEKFAGIFGPLLFSVAIALTGSSRAAILSVILFFVVGGAAALEGRRRRRRAGRRRRERAGREGVPRVLRPARNGRPTSAPRARGRGPARSAGCVHSARAPWSRPPSAQAVSFLRSQVCACSARMNGSA